jgi:2-succinyl-5-enolpyruvyl-6-hydroxy-3-cyclohexene-1-carboxylate synthase
MVSQLLRSGEVERVIRLGDVPLGRYWRDLDQMDLPIFSFSDKPYSGTDKSELTVGPLETWPGVEQESWGWSHWRQRGQERSQQIADLVREFPKSEIAFFKKFHDSLSSDESLYVGNSLPIRLWDLVSTNEIPLRSQRGVNGIDGQLSSAFGWMYPKSHNRVVVGDLTALYDFSGLWVTPHLREQEINVELVVVNNGGGQIFSRIFQNKAFQNQHQKSFSAFADFWGWDHFALASPKNMRAGTGLRITEWLPDADQTQAFWERYDGLWHT